VRLLYGTKHEVAEVGRKSAIASWCFVIDMSIRNDGEDNFATAFSVGPSYGGAANQLYSSDWITVPQLKRGLRE
jgi:hypothetical protein